MNWLYFFFIVSLTLLICFFTSLHSQTLTDNFESGSLSNWTSYSGVSISTTAAHSGTYSSFLNGLSNTTGKIMKSNANTSYVKIDFYFYITTWGGWTCVQAGGNGLTGFTNYWSVQKVYL